jgi:hypothetical protein
LNEQNNTNIDAFNTLFLPRNNYNLIKHLIFKSMKTKIFTLLVLLLAFSVGTVKAQTIRYVTTTGAGLKDGTSWENAAGSTTAPGAAINAQIAAVGASTTTYRGEVRFGAGTYNLEATIGSMDGVNLIGGYPATPATGTNDTRNLAANQTIFDGGGARKILNSLDPAVAPTSVVGKTGRLTTIDGFVLQNGNSGYGSAALLICGNVLQNCIVRNNIGGGPAIDMKRGNSASNYAGAAIINCVIVNNTNNSTYQSAEYNGAAGVVMAVNGSLVNCVIANNKNLSTKYISATAPQQPAGGVFLNTSADVTIANNIFYNNISSYSPLTGETVYGNSISGNTTVTGNFTAFYNNWFDEASIPVLVSNGTGKNNKTQADYLGSTIFKSPSITQGVYGTASDASDWSLKSTSNCINGGSSSVTLKNPYVDMNPALSQLAYSAINKDIIGTTRILSTSPDMGAYEYSNFDYTLTLSSSDSKSIVSGPRVAKNGDVVTVTATGNGSNFSNWTEDGVTGLTTNPYTFTVSANKTLVANFTSFCTLTASSLTFLPVYGAVSPEVNFKVTGTNLTDNITLTPPANYEISTGTGGSFVATNPITLTQTGGIVAQTTIYVRMKAGSTAGTIFNQNIVIGSTGFPNVNVACSGIVNTKAITISGTISPIDKAYDGTKIILLSGTYSGVVNSDVVSASGTVASANVTASPVAVTSTATLIGAQSINYTIAAAPTLSTGHTTVNITAKALTTTLTATGPSKTYGTALTAGASTTNFTGGGATGVGTEAITGVTLTPDAAGLSATTAAGAGYVITPSLATGSNGFLAANYSGITYAPYNGTVAKKALTIGAASIASKPYDGTTTSGNVTAGSLSGFVNPETVTVSSATGTYANANVGTGKTATIVYTLADGTNGGFAANYSLANGSANGNITAIPSTWSGTASWSSNANWTAVPNAGTDVTVPSGSSLTVDGTPTVNNITIEAGGKLNVSTALTALGTITLKAANDGTSFSTKLDAGITASSVRLFKTIDAAKWYFVSFPCDVPVAGITKADGTSLGTLGTDWFIKYYDGAQRGESGSTLGSNWKQITSGTLTANQGYIIALSTGTAEILFPLNTSILAAEAAPKTIAVSAYTGAAATTNYGWNLIGQPFLSNYITSNATGADTYYIYVSDGVSTYSPYSSALAPNINPMSAYFVQASTALAGSGITFATAGRQLVRSSVFKTDVSDQVQLNFSTATGMDYTNLIMDNTQTTDYQIGRDLEKWIGTGTDKPQVYTQIGGINYAFNALPMDNVYKLPLGFYTKTAGATTISVDASKAPGLSQLMLTDNSNGASVDLLTSNYSFNAASGTDNTRFVLTAKRVATAITPIGTGNDEPVITAENGKLVLGNLTGVTNVRVYDAIGHMLFNKIATTNLVEVPISVAGVYTIQLNASTKNWTKKQVVNQK